METKEEKTIQERKKTHMEEFMQRELNMTG